MYQIIRTITQSKRNMAADQGLCETFGGFWWLHGDIKSYKLLMKEIFGCFLTYLLAPHTHCNASFKTNGVPIGNTECARNVYSFETKKKVPTEVEGSRKCTVLKNMFFFAPCVLGALKISPGLF